MNNNNFNSHCLVIRGASYSGFPLKLVSLGLMPPDWKKMEVNFWKQNVFQASCFCVLFVLSLFLVL